jgi:hypothetical protein
MPFPDHYLYYMGYSAWVRKRTEPILPAGLRAVTRSIIGSSGRFVKRQDRRIAGEIRLMADLEKAEEIVFCQEIQIGLLFEEGADIGDDLVPVVAGQNR